jgi:hypothetical protein
MGDGECPERNESLITLFQPHCEDQTTMAELTALIEDRERRRARSVSADREEDARR